MPNGDAPSVNGATPAPPRRGSRRWLVVLLALLGVGLVAAIAGTVLFVDRTLPPYDAAHDFLDDVVHGRASAAADGLCRPDRDRAERALSDVRRSFGFRRATVSVNPLGVDRYGGRATVEYTVDVKGSDDDPTFRLALREEDGDWRACPGDGLR